MKRKKAIGLLSGGLDSILAVELMLDQGVEVVCVNMRTPFGLGDGESIGFSDSVTEKYNLKLIRIQGEEDYLKIIKNPRHGYGRNMNPCIDCRIYLFIQAKKIMEKEKAFFIFTGEVVGERPMSQKLDTLRLIDRESGLRGKVLRPLSARLLEPTQPEMEGLVDREKLLSFQGRSRKPQIALARALQIKDYPGPAGGCLLTDENFARKLRDSLNHQEESLKEISLLKVGRHFRLPGGAKVITGRDEGENEKLLLLAAPREIKLTVKDYKSTYALLLGDPTPGNLDLAARICSFYCKGKPRKKLQVKIWNHSPEEFKELEVSPFKETEILKYKI
jgi:tRNA-specific 2-thiouridylase